jgi:TPR repeat protein
MGMKSGVDVDKAKHYYMEASRLGDLDALVNLGLMNYKEQLPNASLSLAYSYMETAAKKGSYQAMYWLGIFHQKGVGVLASFKEAEKWFDKAIKAGSLGAKYKLATLIIEDMNKEPIKPKKKGVYYARAKTLLIEYALDLQHNTNNYAMGMYYLGYLFQTGLGVTKSDRTARYWFEMAAQIGLSKAMVEIYRYLKDSEPSQAFHRLQEALQDKTCSDAMYEMGLLCMSGYRDYVKEDINQAKKWFESASRLNHPQALEKLMMT